MTRWFLAWGWLEATLALCGADAEETRYRIGPVPRWVAPANEGTNPPAAAAEPGRGRRYGLVDDQVHLGTTEHFSSRSYELLNSQGVEDGSELRALFDPSYQDLTLHEVAIVRGGERQDRLDRRRIRVLDEEEEQSSHVFHGERTVLVLLDDVRVGDRVEFSYTLRGWNPVFGGRYLGGFQHRWTMAVARQRLRILLPEGRWPNVRCHAGEVAPRVTSREGLEEWTWGFEDTEGLVPEDRVPGWYTRYPWIQLSEFRDWAGVVEWALPLYGRDGVPLPDMENQWAAWMGIAGEEERAAAILDWVQDEVRYRAEALGPRSHAPATPAQVCKVRAGDCKDKARLFCALAERVGLRAQPVLVNSDARRGIQEWGPSPLAFDHVVVRVWVNGMWWVVDPTRTHQRGRLSNRFVPSFEAGLVVAEGERELTSLPVQRAAWPETVVVDRFHVGGTNEPTDLEVTTEARGLDADRLRATFAQSTAEEIGRDYQRYYARRYPGIESRQPPKLTEDADGGVKIEERYVIPRLWQRDEESGAHHALFHPTGLEDIGEDTDVAARTAPLACTHPRRHRVRTEVHLPEEWPWLTGTERIEGPAAFLEVTHRYSGTNRMGIREYRYESTSDHVAVDDLPRHVEAEQSIQDEVGMELTWPIGGFRPNWPMLVLAALFGLGVALGLVFLHRRVASGRGLWLHPGRAGLTTPGPGVEPVGLGGWLIVVGLGLILRPVGLLVKMREYQGLFDADGWEVITRPDGTHYHVLLAPLGIAEVLVLQGFIGTGFWLWMLFFQKRREFPLVMTVWLGAWAAWSTLDHTVASGIPMLRQDGAEWASAWRGMVRSWVTFGVWAAYLRRSMRVRNTFVR